MAWPTPRRIIQAICFLSWCGVQTLFFINPAPKGKAFTLHSPQGNYHIVQKGREANMWGAFSDRYQRFPKMELIPFLKKKGIVKIQKLMLSGHDLSQTRALSELQKHFTIIELVYPLDSALQMRKTFSQIDSPMRFQRSEKAVVSAEPVLRIDSP